MLTAVVGVNWGDEGKGRMVDLLGAQADVVVRYQGGNNAGHTVINDRGRFILNLLPSGMFRETTMNVMGNGMVVDLEHLGNEIASLREKGVAVGPENLLLSDSAVICLPYHRLQDQLEERRLADRKYGSTQRGIAPVYADKYAKKALRVGDLRAKNLREKVEGIVAWKNLTLQGGYGAEPVSASDVLAWLERFGAPLLPLIGDAGAYLTRAIDAGRSVLFEAQLGALRDIDYGIYPYTSSSTTLAAYAPIGAGVPFARLDRVVGIMKAYSSCVGEGPFVVEMFGAPAEALREAGGEYGAATGRPRRVGAFDIPASRYGARVQGADEIALTKLDVLSYLDRIPVCVAYDIDGERTEAFPTDERLAHAKPIYEDVEGFRTDISHCRKESDLPSAARRYIERLEEAVGVRIRYVSVGAQRGQYIERA